MNDKVLDEGKKYMRMALGLARRGYGMTSPNPMVGAVVVKRGKIIGRGWHQKAGRPHAEIEALRDAQRQGHQVRGATLYVTLEPCSTHGRTPPCTEAIRAAGIRKVVAGATDPNPQHAGEGFNILRRAGVNVLTGLLEEECTSLNEAFNHWIVRGTPYVTVKAAMTMDGKIATAAGESKWITGEEARGYGVRLRQGADAILVGVNTVLADDPSLTVRRGEMRHGRWGNQLPKLKPLHKLQGAEVGEFQVSNLKFEIPRRRIVLDSMARTPLGSKVVSDEWRELTTIVVGPKAAGSRVRALEKKARVIKAPLREGRIDLKWLIKRLGQERVMSLLVEGGGEVNASFLLGGHAQRVAFFYAPKILGGRDARKAVGGDGAQRAEEILNLENVKWSTVGQDLLLMARIKANGRLR